MGSAALRAESLKVVFQWVFQWCQMVRFGRTSNDPVVVDDPNLGV